MRHVAGPNRGRVLGLLAVAVIVVSGLVGGAAWIAWQVIDNIDAPGPGATGSGPCGPADSVNIKLIFGDGRVVHACTRDRPACPNQTITGTLNGQSQTTRSQFRLNNQLRSSSRRYMFLVGFDIPFGPEMPERILQINPQSFMPDTSQSEPGILSAAHAEIQMTPRDPIGDAYTPGAGTLTVSSAHGIVRGHINATFDQGSRPDRPEAKTHVGSASLTGDFTCIR